MMEISILGIAAAALSGHLGSLIGVWGVRAWRFWRTPTRLFKNVDRSRLTPEQRQQLEDIERSYQNPVGRAMHDL